MPLLKSRQQKRDAQIVFSETFDLPREEVFRLLRDHLAEIAPHIPDIEGVTCLERTEDGTQSSIRNRWQADYSIPVVARPFVKREMLTWIDRNVWDEADWSCQWWFEPPAFKDAVICQGRNTYQATPEGGCVLRTEGVFQLDLTKVPGIPRFLARKAGPEIEKLLVKLVSPNLARVAEGLRSYVCDVRGGSAPPDSPPEED